MQNEISKVRAPRPFLAKAAKLIVLAALPLLLAGCEHDQGTQVAGWALVDPEQRHPILVSQQPATLSIRVAANSPGLSRSQRGRVMDFIGHYRASDSGNSRIVIEAPGGSANEGAAMAAADEVRQIILDGGFSESSIAVEAYHGGAGEAPLRISYMRYVAEGPECGDDWSQNLARNYSNVPYPNMGCAAQKNLAAMVSNPADLLGPRTVGPREANRRDTTFAKYIKGEPMGSANETETVQKLNSN
jgi:pilus assembly protein CpaD